jgi:hypothetical protein
MGLRVGFDIDGVLADFRTAFEAMARGLGAVPGGVDPEQPGAGPLSAGQIKRVWEIIQRTPNWWTTLAPCEPGAIAHLYALARRLKWEVVFMTRRPETAGEAVQFQTQWWLERQGFYLPTVLTVPGSRGELVNALRLDLVVDDQLHNCVDVVSASQAKAILVLRPPGDEATRQQALNRGIGVVSSLRDALDVLEHAHDVLVVRRGRLSRVLDWFRRPREASLPDVPEAPRPELRSD